MDEKRPPRKSTLESPLFHRLLVGVGIAVLLLLTFQAGIFVGFRKAAFSYHGGDNYYRAFGEDRRGPIPGMMREEFPGANGSIGKILSIQLPILMIEDKDNVEKTIRLSSDTIIRKERTTLAQTDLYTNDIIVVIGSPNAHGEVEAKFIRLLPPPPEFLNNEQSANLNTTTPSK